MPWQIKRIFIIIYTSFLLFINLQNPDLTGICGVKLSGTYIFLCESVPLSAQMGSKWCQISTNHHRKGRLLLFLSISHKWVISSNAYRRLRQSATQNQDCTNYQGTVCKSNQSTGTVQAHESLDQPVWLSEPRPRFIRLQPAFLKFWRRL